MRGSKGNDIFAILDFIYNGEANVLQEDLDRFLSVAETLKLKGLLDPVKQVLKIIL